MAGRFFGEQTVAQGRPLGLWEVVLYLDERMSEPAARTLEGIFLGRVGGASSAGFTSAIGEVRALRRARIELDHSQRRPYIKVAEQALAQGWQAIESPARISCGIPGHDHPGTEWVVERLAVSDAGLDWEFSGRCGFASQFSYRSG
jgi:hypothetical protein